MYHKVEFIPSEWLARSAWAASYGERLVVYSRPVHIERRWHDIPTVFDRRQAAMASIETVESLLRSVFCGPKSEGYLVMISPSDTTCPPLPDLSSVGRAQVALR